MRTSRSALRSPARRSAAVAKEYKFHPVEDYLDGLKWDERARLATWLSVYLGARHGRYTEAVGPASLIAAVARIKRPGCKHDHMPIIEGPQGIFKSAAVKVLGAPWFADEIAEFGTKDASMQIKRAWFLEVPELHSMPAHKVERAKSFLSRTTDMFRPPFGHEVIESPRQCVLRGTTNSDQYLRDETGARRFWPVRVVDRIDIKALERDRDQLFAEAVHLYAKGDPWWLTDASLVREAAQAADERYIQDPWQDQIAAYVEDLDETSVADVLSKVLHIKPSDKVQSHQNRVVKSPQAPRLRERLAETHANRQRGKTKAGLSVSTPGQ
jgi:predicted P-loop ATPase